MKTGEALQIGGGNIGRALVGEVMHEAGLHVTFADVNEQLIADFNTERCYPVQIVSLEGSREDLVNDVEAVSSLDEATMIDKIVRADIVTTAVGAGILPRVAPTLAKGLMERLKQRPTDEMHVVVVACENMERNTETLRDHILEALPDDEWRAKVLEVVSFPNCAVDRIVPNTRSDIDHPLAVITEDYYQLAVDRTALKADMPYIPGVELVDDLEATLAQKLFTLNGAHAAAAYWGYLKGCETIDEAMRDPSILELVQGLMDEVSVVVVRHYPSISEQQQRAFADKTLRRFMNPYLKDEPKRVGRDPQRKLSARDRLLRPAILAIGDGDTPANLNMAMVGGFRFDSPDDPQALEVHRNIAAHGVDAAIVAVTGLQKSHPLVRQTAAGYRLADLMV
ncbi:MAG: mannitol-1-phosphate 5-dehydrogenase [Candidatus Saccharimonadales bacterium]